MASGFKEMVINTQERAVSVDINRLQKFKGADEAEFFRYLLDVTSDDDVNTGVVAEPSSTETPLRAEILNGLMVRPQAGSLNLLVDPGVMLALAPDSVVDDSNYKYIRDPGVLVAGTLPITTNSGGGSARIDVVEVQVASSINETDNRDIFSPTTGLFTAQSVTKAVKGVLNYRVRAGTVGGGFPGVASGWLPICVVSAAAGAATVDAMTFWDVRPLVNERVYGLGSTTNRKPLLRKSILSVGNNVTTQQVVGLQEIVLGGRRIGGRLRSGSAVADADNLDLTIAANRDTTSFAGTGIWYLYFLLPFGLPRWARYATTGSRLPRNPRGIPVLSTVGPDADGNPSAAITLPTATGLGSSATVGYCFAAGNLNAGTVVPIYGDNDQGFYNFTTPTAPTITNGGSFFSTTLTGGTHFPAHARSVLLAVTLPTTVTGGAYNGTTQLSLNNPNGISGTAFTLTQSVPIGTTFLVWVPLPAVYPNVPTAPTQFFAITLGGVSTFTTGGATINPIAYRL